MADFVKTGGLGEVAASLPRAPAPALRRAHPDPGLPPGRGAPSEIAVVAHLPGDAEMPPCDLGLIETGDGLPVYVILNSALLRARRLALRRPGRRLPTTTCASAASASRPPSSRRGSIRSGAPTSCTSTTGRRRWRPPTWPGAACARRACSPSTTSAYQGLFPWEDPRPPRCAGERLPHRRGRVLRQAVVPQGRPVLRLPRHHRERDLRPRDHHAGIRLRPRRSPAHPRHQGRLAGILNGIDESWDPRTRSPPRHRFEPDDWKGKRANADAVRTRFGLGVSRGPLFAIVSRLVHQKGRGPDAGGGRVDRRRGRPARRHRPGRAALRGRLPRPRSAPPGSVGVRVGFEETDAHRMFAGSDFLLMPSRFEPCGLAQMYASATAPCRSSTAPGDWPIPSRTASPASCSVNPRSRA